MAKKADEKENTNPVVEENPSTDSSSVADLSNRNKYQYIYKKKSVRSRARRRTASLVMMVFILIATLIAGLVYGVLKFIDFNSFRITIDRNYNGYLTLADNYDFDNSSQFLSTEGLKKMTNTTYDSINRTQLLTEEGSLSQRDYIATAFYLRNTGEEGVYYCENILLTNSYLELEDTIRILLIKQIEYTNPDGTTYWSDPEYKCFAKVAADGISDELVARVDDRVLAPAYDPNFPGQDIPWKCTSFYNYNSGVVTDTVYYPLLPQQRVRYAMAIWIEGTDPETTDEKLGGRVSYTFQFGLRYDSDDKIVFVENDEAQQ